ncbi:MAG: UDP-N-acetylmuramate dehydrogenase [Chlamydiales bacterium]|nr:UDP-N-acetylmuramate dehydrogenase [Chlamydiales bacterium]
MKAQFIPNKLLSEVSTLGIGGPAQYYVEVKSIQEMQQVMSYCYQEGLKTFILGKGSNCLFDSKGLARVCIHNKIDFHEEVEPGHFHVGAGYSFSLLGTQTAKKGYSGLEFASGIPASVGGAVFMNAGAQGMQTWTTLQYVDYVMPNGELTRLSKDELTFGYRYTAFHEMQGAIVGAYFVLSAVPNARAKQLELLDARIHTQPYSEKSAGCVFKNPQNTAAGLLIDKSGLKGFQIGGAKVSELHGNFLINSSGATSDDFMALIKHVQAVVKEQTGHELHREVFWVSDEV